MPSPFDAVAQRTVDQSFARFGVGGVYSDGDVGSVACRVILNGADDETRIRDFATVAPRQIIEVRASEILVPKSGGQFVVDGDTFKIVAAPKREDPSRLVWTCLCNPV